MSGHVIGAFGGVSKKFISLWDESVQPSFKVALGRWVGILLDNEACGCVLHKDGAEPFSNVASMYHCTNLVGYLVESLS
jgi:hypothetical protein